MQYAAILNSHGRYLHDLFLHKQKGLHAHRWLSLQHPLCHVSAFEKPLYPLPVKHGVGDKLVLLADVDKNSATDLVKLLNR